MNYQNDYIMRMIHLLRLLMEYLAGLTDAQQLHSGEDALDDALRKLTGLSITTLDNLSLAQTAELLGKGGESSSRLFAAAELLRMRAGLHERFAFGDDAENMEYKALSLYLLMEHVTPEISGGFYATLKLLANRHTDRMTDGQCLALGAMYECAGYYADAEDAMCQQKDNRAIHAFYCRLLKLDDGELQRGGLPRDEVMEGIVRIKKLGM